MKHLKLQFTAISGRNIPKELYNEGENFSTIISTSCTIDAITAINNINVKNDKSTFKNLHSTKLKHLL